MYYYVYLLKSIKYPEQTYIGYTFNLSKRLETHNSGGSAHTTKYKPWRLITYLGFSNKDMAIKFEKYLKSQSRRAFAMKRLL